MQFLLILLSAVLACSKVTVQGGLAKRSVKNINDSILMTCLIFAVISIIFFASLTGKIISLVLIFAVFFGVFSAILQISYALALKSGPFSKSCLICNLAMVLPIVYAVVFFNEKLNILKIAGIVFCIISLVLSMGKDDKKISLKWIFYIFLTFLANGLVVCTQKTFAKTGLSDHIGQFLFFGYFIAFLICLILFFVVKGGNKEPVNFKLNKTNIAFVLGVGALLGLFQYVYTYANSIIDAVVLVPSVNGLTTLLQMLVARVLFRERFTIKQILSICVGVVAIVLMSI